MTLKKTFIKAMEKYRIDVFFAAAVMIMGFFAYNRTSLSPQFFIAFLPSIIGSTLVLLSLPLMLKVPGRSVLVTLAVLFVGILQFADTLFYRYFTDVLSVGILTQANVVGSVQSSIMNLIHGEDFLILLGPAVLIAAYVTYFILSHQDRRNRVSHVGKRDTALKYRLTAGVLALFLGLGGCYGGLKLLLQNQPGILQSFYDRVYIAQNLGFVNYHVIDAARYISSLEKTEVSPEDIQAVAEFMKEKSDEMKAGKYLEGAGKGKNLIVIQTEALQGFLIGAKLNGELIAPNLTKLAAGSQYFNNYYCETAGGGTSDAEFLANTSLFPVKEGAVYIRFSGNDYVTMPKLLKENGYSTMAMHSFKAGFWNRSVMYKNMGFDKFYNKNDMIQDEISGMGLTDKSFFRQMLPKLKEARQPYYSLMITLTSHFPYNNDKSYFDPNFKVGKWENTMMGDYLTTIHYADAAIGEFVRNLEAEGMMENTVLAVYGDHFGIPKDKQEQLFEFLGAGEKSPYKWSVNQTVPMMIKIPGVKGKKWSIVGGGVDFMPTVMNVMGIDTEKATMLGRDLLNSKTGFAIMRHGTFRHDNVLFNISDKKAYKVPTGETLDYGKYASDVKYVQDSLHYSDLVIENNLVTRVSEAMKQVRTAKKP